MKLMENGEISKPLLAESHVEDKWALKLNYVVSPTDSFAARRNEGTQIEAHGARALAPRVKLIGTRWLNYPASKAVSVGDCGNCF
jgi:hypothetical protein